MSTPDPRTVVREYVHALADRQLARAPLAETVVFEDPVSNGAISGRAAVIAFLERNVPPIFRWTRQLEMVDGLYVALAWTAVTTDGTIPIFEYFRVVGPEITHIRAYYAPPARRDAAGAAGAATEVTP